MKIAVCYSGQIRTGIDVFPNHQRFFGDLFPFIDFFVHTWDVESNKRTRPLKIEKVPKEKSEAFLALVGPTQHVIEDYSLFKPPIFHVHNTFAPLYYSFAQSVKLKQQHALETDVKYDVVIKIRPDIIFPSHRRLAAVVVQCLANQAFVIENLQPDWVNANFTDDVFWVAPDALMDIAATYYEKNFHEANGQIFAHYLHSTGVKIEAVHESAYAIYRTECSHLSPLTQWSECFDCEREHFNVDSPDYFIKQA